MDTTPNMSDAQLDDTLCGAVHPDLASYATCREWSGHDGDHLDLISGRRWAQLPATAGA
jgi:hypothetical protein